MIAMLLVLLADANLYEALQRTAESTPPAVRKSTGGPLRVALPPTETVGEVPARVLIAFEQSLTAEVGKYEGILATGPDQLADTISADLKARIRGECYTDPQCLAGLGPDMKMEEIVASEIVLDGGSYAVTVRRMPMQDPSSTRTATHKVTRGNGSELLSLIGPAVHALYSDRSLKTGRARGVDSEVYERLNPPPLPRSLFWTTAAAAGVAMIGGVTYGFLAKSSHDQYTALATQSVTSPVPGQSLKSLQSQMDSRADTAKYLFIAGAVLCAGAGVQAFFTDWHGYKSTTQFQVNSRGGGITVAAAF